MKTSLYSTPKPGRKIHVRPGQRKPIVKGDRVTVDERVSLLVNWWRKHPLATKWEIHKWVREHFNIEYRTCDAIYITRAKVLRAKEAAMPKDKARELSTSVVLRLMESSNERIALRAAEVWNDMQGFNAPKRVEQTGADGGPIKVEDDRPLEKVPTEKLRQFVERYNETVAGIEGGNGG